MKTYKVTIYPVTPWTIKVKAKNEESAKKKALKFDAPPLYAFQDGIEEWIPDILEWPNIGKNGQIDVEEDE